MAVEASYLPIEFVPEIWPKIRPYITNAVKYTFGRYEPEDVLELLHRGDHLLWVAFEGKEVCGVIVTTFAEYPRAKYLSCPFVTGEDFHEWKYPMLEALRRWAKENDCAGVEATGRVGWQRVFKEDGYEALWQSFQLPLEDPREGND